MHRDRKVVAAVCLAFSVLSCSGAAFAADPSEEVNKQISKLIGDAISARVASVVTPAGVAKPAAGAERNNIWASYTRLNVDVNVPNSAPFDSRTDLGIGGYDRDLSEKLVAGFALSKSDTNPTGKGWGLTPYLAYRFSNSLFGVARFSYQRQESDSSFSVPAVPAFPPFFAGIPGFTQTIAAETDSYGIAISLNGVLRSGNVAAKGRLEIGANEGDTDFTTTCTPAVANCGAGAGSGSKFSSTNYVADGEVGYYFGQDFYVFAGLQLTDTNRSNSYSASARIGLEKSFGKGSAVFAKYETQVDDNASAGTSIDVKSFTVGLRIRF